MIGGMFDLSIGGILAFSGIMAGLAAKDLGLPPLAGLPGRLRVGHAARRDQRLPRHQVQDQRPDRHAGDALDLSRRAAARLRRRRHQHRQRLHGLRPDADPRHLLALLVHGRHRRCSSPSSSAAPATSARPTTSAAMPGRRSCRASTSTARCSASSSSWACSPGLAGALLASRLNTAVVLAGQGVELKVITAVVLGGASLSGRRRHASSAPSSACCSWRCCRTP